MPTFKIPMLKINKNDIIRWEPALYNNGFQADLNGRYTARRTTKGSREWYLRFNQKIISKHKSAHEAMLAIPNTVEI